MVNYDDDDDSVTSPPTTPFMIIMRLFWTVVVCIAVYYSFKVSGGFNWGPFLLALFFAPFYIVYGIYKVGFPPK